ncbi:MAG: LamG domain-containing protein [Bacteroidia bacterium]|nr:LamG domain-containing protein [Bacteroidia bacterium]
MDETPGTRGYIRTPADLDAAARALDRSLAQTRSPQKRFLLITDFYTQIRAVPEDWQQGYVLYLAPGLIELVRLPYVPSLPPENWAAALDFFAFVRAQAWADRFTQLDEAFAEAAGHAALTHAFVSSLREFHRLCLRHALLTVQLDENDWARIFGSSASAYETFRSYIGTLRDRTEVHLDWLYASLETWTAFRNRAGAVSVVMLEEDHLDRRPLGRVLLMDIHGSVNGTGGTHVGNVLGQQGVTTLEQLKEAQRQGERLLAGSLSVRVPHLEITFALHEGSAEIVGESLGLAAAAGLAATLSQRMNLSERWTLRPTIACVGSLDTEGNVEDPGWTIIEHKIRTGFYSPLEAMVIPAPHREAARHLVHRLQQRYPNRSLEMYGVQRLSDLPLLHGVMGVEHRSNAQRLREFVRQHSVAVLITVVVGLLFVVGFFAYKSYVDYPNLELSLGIDVGANAVVFNPRDSITWCLRDYAIVQPSVVDFGDLEVGDGFTRNFWLWNFSPGTLDVSLSVEGHDAGDWYLNWRNGTQEVLSTEQLQFSVMYSPLTPGKSKRARLVFRDAATGAALHQLELRGSAGAPTDAGYALQLDGKDDHIFFGKRSTAFDVPEGTFECWVKPYSTTRAMILHNGIARQAEPSTEDLWFGFLSPTTLYIRVGSEIGLVNLPPALVLAPGKWTHLALAYSIPGRSVAVYVNGIELERRKTDFIFEGPGSAFVTIGAQNTSRSREAFFHGELDDVRFWSVFRTAAEIRRSMHGTVPGLTPGLSGYWDMDATVENTVFNANLRAHSGILQGRTAVVRSTAPVSHPTRHTTLIAGPRGKTAVQLSAGRYLACARWPMQRHGDATFAFWFHQSGAPAIHFAYVNGERGWIALEDTATYTSVAKHWFVRKPEAGWHHAVLTTNGEGDLALYINGRLFDRNRTTNSGLHDWHYRFEGLQLGFRFDKQQQLSSKYYNWYHPTLNYPRAYADLHVWQRVLSADEIAELYGGTRLPERGLVASWNFDRQPDSYLNYQDNVNGLLMHVKQVRAWE